MTDATKKEHVTHLRGVWVPMRICRGVRVGVSIENGEYIFVVEPSASRDDRRAEPGVANIRGVQNGEGWFDRRFFLRVDTRSFCNTPWKQLC